MLTYPFNFSKRQTQESRDKLESYITKAAAEYENHCSVLVNNIAVTQRLFKEQSPTQIGEMTNVKLENHSFITSLVMLKLRNDSLRKKRALVINVGTTKDTLVEKKQRFKTAADQANWEVYKATVIYWSNLVSLKERQETIEVDYIKDSPENQTFF